MHNLVPLGVEIELQSPDQLTLGIPNYSLHVITPFVVPVVNRQCQLTVAIKILKPKQFTCVGVVVFR
jgi:hypothetical protein